MPALRDNRRGILAMACAMACFNLADALTKLDMQTLPLGETIFVRGLFATAAVAVWVGIDGSWRQAAMLRDVRLALRLLGECGATLFYLMALVHVALTSVTAVFQATPLMMTAAAAVFLGERIDRARWIAIAVGFVGVMIIVRPGFSGFDPKALWVLLCVLFVVMRDISTARIGRDIPTSLITLVTAATVTLLGLVVMPFDPLLSTVPVWRMPTFPELLLLAATAASLVGGYVLLIRAMLQADTSAIAPYRYTLLVWAMIYGWLLFGTLPDATTLLGSAVVVGSGLYAFARERASRPAERSGATEI